MKRLPLDISTFAKLRLSDYLYVDKTQHAYNLISQGQRYFLARPRRFGKSLFVSMLKELFEGNQALFEGLWIDGAGYAWRKHGVILLDMSVMGIHDVASLNEGLCFTLQKIALHYDLNLILNKNRPELALQELVSALYNKFGAVAILVDEYDNPILQVLKNVAMATEIRDALRRFFAAIKGLDAELDFVFITGISSFAKAGVFSGMNNLQIITFDERYAGICGYTDQELQLNFKDFIQEWSEAKSLDDGALCQDIKRWYNGYRFSQSNIKVYNPFSVMHAFNVQMFKNFWFLSGTPSFLVEMIEREFSFFDPEKLEISEDSLGVLDINAAPLIVLLFQAGYLTIVDYDEKEHLYKLDYPNVEVKVSFQKYLLHAITKIDIVNLEALSRDFRLSFEKNDMSRLRDILKQLFSRIPYQLHIKEEKYYHSLLIMLCIASGIEVNSEYSTSDGRIDLVLNIAKRTYVAEIKFNKSPRQAIAQIKERGYCEPFMCKDKEIILLGISFIREPQHFDIMIEQERL